MEEANGMHERWNKLDAWRRNRAGRSPGDRAAPERRGAHEVFACASLTRVNVHVGAKRSGCRHRQHRLHRLGAHREAREPLCAGRPRQSANAGTVSQCRVRACRSDIGTSRRCSLASRTGSLWTGYCRRNPSGGVFRPHGRAEPALRAVRGTEKLLHALRAFEVEQFVFASSMLAHKAGRPGDIVNEDWPLGSNLPYRESKAKAERLIR